MKQPFIASISKATLGSGGKSTEAVEMAISPLEEVDPDEESGFELDRPIRDAVGAARATLTSKASVARMR